MQYPATSHTNNNLARDTVTENEKLTIPLVAMQNSINISIYFIILISKF